MESRYTPSNSSDMRRPRPDAGRSKTRRYQPILVAGKARPRGCEPWSVSERLFSNGSSMAQSWGRSSLRQPLSSKLARAAGTVLPDLAKVPPPLPQPKSWVTGPIWARPVWGIWWTWDVRLTTTLVLWLIYVSYLVLRRFSDSSQTPKLAAVLAI